MSTREAIRVVIDVLLEHSLGVASATLAFGACRGVRITITPSPARTCSNANGNFLSLSQIRNLDWEACSWSSRLRFRAYWLTHSWFGFSVTPNFKMRRVPSSIKKRT